jgi:hypothetical protein
MIADSPHGENELFFPVPEKYIKDSKLVQKILGILAGSEPPEEAQV